MNTNLSSTSVRKLSGLTGVVFAALLTGCFVSENPGGPARDGDEVHVKVRMGLGSVTALEKSALIKRRKLIIIYSSSANDTLRDTLTNLTSPSVDSVATTQQTVTRFRTLTALRTWKIMVSSRDQLDSVIHRDSANIPAMYAGDTAVVNLNLSSRFTMYEAKFLTLPDSIQSSTPAQPKQVLCINRLVLRIDGLNVRDSNATPGPCFTKLVTHTLAYDYVRAGSRSVQMLAYGPMGSWPIGTALYTGSQTINVSAGSDSTVAMNLAWTGPTTGVGRINATLGRVGKVTINGTLPGTI
jgi:hypothetical protein